MARRRRWLAWAGAMLTTVLAGGMVAYRLGDRRWRGATNAEVARLQAQAREVVPSGTSVALDGLPPPVARYLAAVLPAEPAPVRTVRVDWGGEFRQRPDGAWAPFTARQEFGLVPPAFVWDARIDMAPGISVRVRDSYRAGQAGMHARVAGLVPVVDQQGTPELAQSALARWLGEAVWFPAALLPGGAVTWEAVDDTTARTTVQDVDVQAIATFTFAPDGTITSMRALRWRDVDGVPVLTPFEGRYGEYGWHGGVRVPLRAEVAWELEEGRFAYWRGRVLGYGAEGR